VSADRILVALAGQPNCGKSTVFNALTGASQHVANYPGVTVDKMTGWYRHNGHKVTVVDLPGTYSMTSYSPEERVSRDFILHEKPTVAVNVMEATNLKRCLYLTFQILEMDIPVILNLNMIDLAEKRGIVIDMDNLSRRLGIRVVPTAMKSGRGRQELLDAIRDVSTAAFDVIPARIDYKEMEPCLRDVEAWLASGNDAAATYPLRWAAIKLMEGDSGVQRLVRDTHTDPEGVLAFAEKQRNIFETRFGETPQVHIARRRYQTADDIARSCMRIPAETGRPFSDRIDRLVCHKFLGPVILAGVIWLLYYLAIVQGYNITNYTWPILARFRSLVETAMPAPGFIDIPLIRAFSLWVVDSVNALLNYIPIFFILFGLIAILEDSGYMPRMAFIMDRLFSRFGLPGQSTLPMVLGGIYAGGCAVPGVMSCRGIPDERSRMATILIIPLLNCLAKVPLYVLLINIYFTAHKAWAMFFISTISLLLVLPVSKILTLTVLKGRETAPFVMEMPAYHMPTLRGVLGRAVERVWLFVKKISTIVVAVAVIVFALLQFPGIGPERMAHYRAEQEKAAAAFFKRIYDTPLAGTLQGDALMSLILYGDAYKDAMMAARGDAAAGRLNAEYEARNPVFYKIMNPGEDKAAQKVAKELKNLVKIRKGLLREMRKERIDNSFLGAMGKWLEPVTRWAGFNWRVNVALLSALAAKESSVATLGALYEQEEEGEALEARMARGETQFTPLHALALMLFMVLYPPCMATAIAVKLQAGSVKWMLFSIAYPMLLGLAVAVLVFSLGGALGLTGLQAMFGFYALALAFTIFMGFFKNDPTFT